MEAQSTSLLAATAMIVCFIGFAVPVPLPASQQADAAQSLPPRAMVGAYYFDGWAGSHGLADAEAWAKDAPTHLTKRMLDEFPDREPIWGWRDDRPEIMEQQIDLAADHGIAFFAFCWYWHSTQEQIDNDPKHTGLNLFLRAGNNDRMKFCLLVANHEGFLIGSTENWRKAAERWVSYFADKRYVTVDGKPLVIIFNPADGHSEGLSALQATAKRAGFPGVAVAACGGGDPKLGYAYRTHYNIVPGYAGGSQEHPYSELVAAHQQAWSGSREQPYIPEVTAGWDKRPWEGPQGLNQKPGWYFPDRTPAAFGQFLRSAIAWMDEHPEQTTKERLILVYAWNEFGEGGYIAPTKGDPEGRYLKALKSVVLEEGRVSVSLNDGSMYARPDREE
ncbi:MAG: glycoside hydrolase family 99-like domain-containing protein [Solirubrobacterales bacterium]